MDYDSIVAFVIGLGVILFVFVIFGLFFWFLFAYSQYKVLRALGSSVAWMSFFPVLNHIALAREAADAQGQVTLFGKKISVDLFQLWILAYPVLCLIPAVGGFVALAFYGLCRAEALKRVYALCENKNEAEIQSIAYISGFFSIVMNIKFLVYRRETIIANINAADKFWGEVS